MVTLIESNTSYVMFNNNMYQKRKDDVAMIACGSRKDFYTSINYEKKQKSLLIVQVFFY